MACAIRERERQNSCLYYLHTRHELSTGASTALANNTQLGGRSRKGYARPQTGHVRTARSARLTFAHIVWNKLAICLMCGSYNTPDEARHESRVDNVCLYNNLFQ